jgi:hypothetical protein
MFDWLSDLFEPVVNWVVDTAGEEVAAVAGSALAGATTGAVVGAATSALQGGNILDGALKGAAYGGISAGVVSSLGQLSGAESMTASSQLKKMGYAPTVDYEPGPYIDTPDPDKIPESSYAKSDSKFSPETSKILSGVGQGLSEGAMNYLAAQEESDAAKEQAATTQENKKDLIRFNQPGDILSQQTANVNVSTWWDRHFNQDTGLLNTQG